MKKILITASSLLLMVGCYPGGAEYVEDADIVYTTYDQQYDFQSSTTFAMPDKIVVDVEIDRGDTTFVYMKDVFATPILQSIKDNMESRGWTEVDLSQSPDILLTPAGIKSTTYFYSYWYDWWYGGWYGGYWGWYYPPYYTISSYTTGTMIITMSDPSMGSDSPINQSPAVWISAANGLFTGYYDISRVTESIDQAFEQSPYLNHN